MRRALSSLVLVLLVLSGGRRASAQPFLMLDPNLPPPTLSSGSSGCMTNTRFGDACVWIEATNVTPAIDGTSITAVDNLVCTPSLQVNGTMIYHSSGGASNNAPYIISTNNTAWIGDTNLLFSTNNYTVMLVMKVMHGTSQAGYFRGGTTSESVPAGYSDAPGSSGPSDIVMVGSGSGFLNPSMTDTNNWIIWTFVENQTSSKIRKNGTAVSTGTVNNTAGFGTATSHSWTIFGFNGAGFKSNLQWVRGLIWPRALSDTECTTYENLCKGDFGF